MRCALQEVFKPVSYTHLDVYKRQILSMAVTNCAGERSFSMMKCVKNYLRNSMGEIKLNADVYKRQ